MALLSLANVLHHTGHSKDASILVDASIHFLNDKRISWFTLGNIFAVSMNVYSWVSCFTLGGWSPSNAAFGSS
jgi:hypothetical protein